MTDLVGSTRLARRLPLPHYMALMTDLIQILILHFEAHGGQVLQHQGDAVVCMFTPAQVPQALQSALDAHTRAAQLQLAELLGEKLRLRVGLAVGEVLTGPVGRHGQRLRAAGQSGAAAVQRGAAGGNARLSVGGAPRGGPYAARTRRFGPERL